MGLLKRLFHHENPNGQYEWAKNRKPFPYHFSLFPWLPSKAIYKVITHWETIVSHKNMKRELQRHKMQMSNKTGLQQYLTMCN